MTFKPAIWRPIAIVLSAANLVGVGFATGEAEPLHATIHAALALAFGLWVPRLGKAPVGSESQARLDLLEAEMSNMGRELSEGRSAWTLPNGCWRRERNRAGWARSGSAGFCDVLDDLSWCELETTN